MNYVLNINLYGKIIDDYKDNFDNKRKTIMVISMKLKMEIILLHFDDFR